MSIAPPKIFVEYTGPNTGFIVSTIDPWSEAERQPTISPVWGEQTFPTLQDLLNFLSKHDYRAVVPASNEWRMA